MTRLLYRSLLRLHPKSFRDRFGEEMMLAFDDMRASLGAARLLADQLASLSRQWTRVTPPAPAASSVAGPVFHIFEPRPLPPFAIALGGTAAMLLLSTVQFATNHWGTFRFPFGASRGTAQPMAQGITTEGGFGSIPLGSGPIADIWIEEAQRYMEHQPVLRVLDVNLDSLLSPEEIQRAPDALRTLDTDFDGRLSAAERGVTSGAIQHPLHRVLDKNHDFSMDAEEIEAAPASLRSLDFTHDGTLHPAEFLPDARVLSLLGRPE